MSDIATTRREIFVTTPDGGIKSSGWQRCSFPVGKGTTFSLEPVDTITGNSYSTDKVVQGIDVIDFEDRFAIGNGAVTSGNIGLPVA